MGKGRRIEVTEEELVTGAEKAREERLPIDVTVKEDLEDLKLRGLAENLFVSDGSESDIPPTTVSQGVRLKDGAVVQQFSPIRQQTDTNDRKGCKFW